MHEDQVLRMALACIRWNQFGECRTDGWPGLPPTAADTVAALEASLAKPQPVGGALTESEQLNSVIRAAVWDSAEIVHPGKLLTDDRIDQLVVSELGLYADEYTMADFARVIEREVLATLSAPVAQPGEAVSREKAVTNRQIIVLLEEWVAETGTEEDTCTKLRALLAAPAQAAAVPEAVDLTAQRKKFMNWACDEFKTVHVKGDGFKEHDVRAAWLGWKAALAAPEAAGGGKP